MDRRACLKAQNQRAASLAPFAQRLDVVVFRVVAAVGSDPIPRCPIAIRVAEFVGRDHFHLRPNAPKVTLESAFHVIRAVPFVNRFVSLPGEVGLANGVTGFAEDNFDTGASPRGQLG